MNIDTDILRVSKLMWLRFIDPRNLMDLTGKYNSFPPI